jgi:hypothetical protein
MSNRLLQPRLPERSLEFLNGVLFAVTLVGALTGFVRHVPFWVAAVLAVMLVVVYVVVAFSRYYSIYVFREDSAELCKFFTEWYAHSGEHTIFCDNLEWMAGPANATARDALAARGDSATVCLRRCSGDVYEELRRAGVNMRKIHDHVQMRAKISIKHDDGFGQMIVRIKGNDDDKVRFRRFSDSFSTKMAYEFLINSSAAL